MRLKKESEQQYESFKSFYEISVEFDSEHIDDEWREEMYEFIHQS